MSEVQQAAVVKREATSVEYVPYGAQDKIKMTIQIIQNLIAVKTKSGQTCSERDAVKFMAMCQAKRMNPFEGDCYLIGYDTRDGASFALVTAHQTYLKRAELHPEFDGMKSGIIVEEDSSLKDLEGDFFVEGQKIMGGWATVFFKNRKQPMHKRLRLSRFQKPFGIWQEDSAGMICKCAEADALRSAFPTMLGGLFLREEMAGPDPEVVKPVFSTPSPRALFTTPQGNDLPSANETPAQTPAEPVSDNTPMKDASPFNNPLQAVRGLCAGGKVTEGDLLGYLSAKGTTDGSQSGLDEVPVNVLKLVNDQWAQITGEIMSAKKGGSK